MENLNIVMILGFGTLIMLAIELTQVHGGHFPGYNILLAIGGCAYFIIAIKALRIIQRGAS